MPVQNSDCICLQMCCRCVSVDSVKDAQFTILYAIVDNVANKESGLARKINTKYENMHTLTNIVALSGVG